MCDVIYKLPGSPSTSGTYTVAIFGNPADQPRPDGYFCLWFIGVLPILSLRGARHIIIIIKIR